MYVCPTHDNDQASTWVQQNILRAISDFKRPTWRRVPSYQCDTSVLRRKVIRCESCKTQNQTNCLQNLEVIKQNCLYSELVCLRAALWAWTVRGGETCVIVQHEGNLLGFLCFNYWTCRVRMYLLMNMSVFFKWMQETDCDNKQTNKRLFINSQFRRLQCPCAPTLLLGAFAKLRKASIRHVCPSVRTEQLGCRWTDFHEILYLRTFRKSVQKNSSSITICQQ
jgi:hypothetical protein